MGKKGRIAFIVVLAACLGGLGWLITRPREPSYRGRPVSSWLAQYHTNRWPLDKEAEAAIRSFGTNANPYLLEMLSTHELAWRIKWTSRMSKTWLDRLHISSVSEYKKAVDQRRSEGANGFMALKELAEPAVPQMIVLLDDPDRRVRYLTVFALRCLGPVAKPALPRLIKCLDDPLFEIKDDAVTAMGTIRAEPETVVPKIMEFIGKNRKETILVRDAIEALGKFGPDAKPAVSLLLSLTNDTNGGIFQNSVTNALQKIDPSVLSKKQDEAK